MGRINISDVPFAGTAEQEKELRSRLVSMKDMGGALMPALQEAQAIYRSSENGS